MMDASPASGGFLPVDLQRSKRALFFYCNQRMDLLRGIHRRRSGVVCKNNESPAVPNAGFLVLGGLSINKPAGGRRPLSAKLSSDRLQHL